MNFLLNGEIVYKRKSTKVWQTENCKYGIVVLSKNFFKKNWTRKELDSLFTRQTSEGKPVILPLLHGLDPNRLVELYPMLSGKWYKKSTNVFKFVGRGLPK